MNSKIIGITNNNELVLEVSKNKYCRMVRVFQEDIDYKNSIEYAIKEIWENSNTSLSFEDWWEVEVIKAHEKGELYPSDNNMFRELTCNLANNNTKIEEVLGKLGEDFVTFECTRYSSNCIDENTKWKVKF